MPKKSLIEYRINEIEEKYAVLQESVDLIRTNHLPHIHSAIEGLKVRVNVTTAINVGAIIFGIIVSRLL